MLKIRNAVIDDWYVINGNVKLVYEYLKNNSEGG